MATGKLLSRLKASRNCPQSVYNLVVAIQDDINDDAFVTFLLMCLVHVKFFALSGASVSEYHHEVKAACR